MVGGVGLAAGCVEVECEAATASPSDKAQLQEFN